MTENLARLTPKQREILELLANGLTPKQVAAHLGTTYQQVINHLHQARIRTKVATTFRLVALVYASR